MSRWSRLFTSSREKKTNTVYITGVGPSIANDTLLHFLENKDRGCGGLILDIERNQTTAVIKFEDSNDAHRLLDKRQMPLGFDMLQFSSTPPPQGSPKPAAGRRRVHVTGLNPSTSTLGVWLFFENAKRTGGGKLESVDHTPGERSAVITFRDDRVTRNILSKSDLELDEAAISVEPYTESKSVEPPAETKVKHSSIHTPEETVNKVREPGSCSLCKPPWTLPIKVQTRNKYTSITSIIGSECRTLRQTDTPRHVCNQHKASVTDCFQEYKGLSRSTYVLVLEHFQFTSLERRGVDMSRDHLDIQPCALSKFGNDMEIIFTCNNDIITGKTVDFLNITDNGRKITIFFRKAEVSKSPLPPSTPSTGVDVRKSSQHIQSDKTESSRLVISNGPMPEPAPSKPGKRISQQPDAAPSRMPEVRPGATPDTVPSRWPEVKPRYKPDAAPSRIPDEKLGPKSDTTVSRMSDERLGPKPETAPSRMSDERPGSIPDSKQPQPREVRSEHTPYSDTDLQTRRNQTTIRENGVAGPPPPLTIDNPVFSEPDSNIVNKGPLISNKTEQERRESQNDPISASDLDKSPGSSRTTQWPSLYSPTAHLLKSRYVSEEEDLDSDTRAFSRENYRSMMAPRRRTVQGVTLPRSRDESDVSLGSGSIASTPRDIESESPKTPQRNKVSRHPSLTQVDTGSRNYTKEATQFSFSNTARYQEKRFPHQHTFTTTTIIYNYLKANTPDVLTHLQDNYEVKIEESVTGPRTVVKFHASDKRHLHDAVNEFRGCYQKYGRTMLYVDPLISENDIKMLVDEFSHIFDRIDITYNKGILEFAGPNDLLENAKRDVLRRLRDIKRSAKPVSKTGTGMPEAPKYNTNPVSPKRSSQAIVFPPSSEKLSVVLQKCDITQLSVDVIVNPASVNLTRLGGVSETVSDAAGAAVDKECEAHIMRHGPVEHGEFIVTGCGNLKKCRYIIHAVIPQISDYSRDKFIRISQEMYYRCLQRANSSKTIKSIALSLTTEDIDGVSDYSLVSQALCYSVTDFCRDTEGQTDRLHAIHIVCQNDAALKFIRERFSRERPVGRYQVI